MRTEELAEQISVAFSKVYFHCHPTFDIELSHQAVRALQFVQMNGQATIQQIADHLACAQNTASEIVRRLRQKGLAEKRRRSDDERVVEVYLTDAGLRAVLQNTGLDVEHLSAQLAQVSAEDRDRIEQGLLLLLKAVGGDGE
ncbi:MarR family winged helix-turn-helix transcriptional regulator [Alicyclobacillus sp. ALC3]|uniref:MarR family winged helix-turn-helix transcriptional regulator n=1 Tax=Alicyclobacillus sp. ALC3 TaxID=2796143 RepID=UPI002378737E|nr:MarR family winged helix-turn-helix transcriptional regulator [Alicyclobacillus sp. ALC3]WDL96708.1 winged helix-turn-helix transcriptional regulator [Alicyclobacillus sp. ALC3]